MVKTLEDIKYFIIPELYDYLKNAESGEGADITALETAVEALETAVGDAEAGLVKDVADLETAVGDAEAGLVKDVADLETAVGDAEAGLVKDVDDIQASIGDESTEGTILARIKALEDAQPPATENTEPANP